MENPPESAQSPATDLPRVAIPDGNVLRTFLELLQAAATGKNVEGTIATIDVCVNVNFCCSRENEREKRDRSPDKAAPQACPARTIPSAGKML